MKKKSLLVATIVMVLVLAVSLTTATYAWFTANAQSKVTDIAIGVTTDSKVMIGVSVSNAFTTSTAVEDNFVNGDVSYNADGGNTKWTDGNVGLGTSIDTGLTMTSITKACFTATGEGNTASAYTIDSVFNPSATKWVKANGDGATLGEASTYEFAYANNHIVSTEEQPGDYLDVTFGVRAAKEGIEKLGIVLGIDNANTTSLGMVAGFNYWYQIKGGSASGLQDFYSQSYSTRISNMSAPLNDWTSAAWDDDEDGLSWTPSAGDATHIITIADGNGTALTTTDIYEIRVIIFLNGRDSDCNNSAASIGIASGSKILIDFIVSELATNP